MSDRLKIRVWDKYFERYWTDEEVKCNIQWLLYPDNENIENVIIEQCTGLRDKNGKLIFEGDIIEKQNQKFVIKYEFDSFVAYSEVKKPVSVYGLFTFKLCCGGWSEKETENTIEIIGNIHENPEFLNADNA